jgi:P-type E1-E2 ATPase
MRHAHAVVSAFERAGKTTLVLSVDEQPTAVLACADALKPGACVRACVDARSPTAAEGRVAIEGLRRLGVRCYMVTGDNRTTALAVARRVGIAPDDVFAGWFSVCVCAMLAPISFDSAACQVSCLHTSHAKSRS